MLLSIRHDLENSALQLVGRAPGGLVLSPMRTYDFSEGIPAQLKAYFKLQAQLVCKNVRTGIKKPADYVFAMTAIPQGEAPEKIDPKLSEPVKILPRPPQILEFKINGKPAETKYLTPITTQQDSSKPRIIVVMLLKFRRRSQQVDRKNRYRV